MEQALICCKCTNSFSSGKKDPIDIQDYNNVLDATYELLRMNPSVIGCVMMNGEIYANSSQKRLSKTTTEDGTIGEELLASRPQKRAKNEAA
jgi:hypothetical protein